MDRKRIVVTGAAGMLGRAVVERFEVAHEVVSLRRSDCDLTDLRTTLVQILAHEPHHIVHCAAYTDVDGCETQTERAWLENASATRNVALAAQLAGATLTYPSTDYVFDGRKPTPYCETDDTNPLNVYGRSKLLGEQHVVQHARRFFIVRTSWLFGPGGRNFVHTMSNLLRERPEVSVVNDQTGCPTYTPDLADGLFRLVESGHFGLYHLTNQGACTWFDFARAIGTRLGTSTRIRSCSTQEFPRPARRPRNSVLDTAGYRGLGLELPREWPRALDAYLEILGREKKS